MDSGNEVIIIEEKLATINGINGNGTYEEVVVATAAVDMKTRSKGTEGGAPPEDGAAKPKLRSTRTASANVQKLDDKSGSDTEKKDRKSNLRSGAEADTTSKATAAGGDAKSSGPVASKKAPLPAVVESTPSKKKGGDDDSGINSRSSSVSNEDTYSSRMRTRSKTAEALSSSTPASTKKGASRMPLSTYDFEDISFDEDPSTSNALKRKATMYVEEMEDENETEPPPAKRPVVAFGGTALLNALLYPFRAIRDKISIASQTEEKVAKDDAASQTHVAKVIDDDPEKVPLQTEIDAIAATQTADNQKTPGTCVVM